MGWINFARSAKSKARFDPEFRFLMPVHSLNQPISITGRFHPETINIEHRPNGESGRTSILFRCSANEIANLDQGKHKNRNGLIYPFAIIAGCWLKQSSVCRAWTPDSESSIEAPQNEFAFSIWMCSVTAGRWSSFICNTLSPLSELRLHAEVYRIGYSRAHFPCQNHRSLSARQ